MVPGAILDEQEVILPPGGALVMFSDGVTEATNSQLQPFGEQGLVALLATIDCTSAQAICARIYEAVISYCRPLPQQDDIALICILRR